MKNLDSHGSYFGNSYPVETFKIENKNTFNYTKSFEGFDQKVGFLIKDYLPIHSFGMLFGASGDFKSFLAASWACHIATGIPWNNRKTYQTGVIYVVGEGGIGMPRRFKAWSDEYFNGVNIPNLFRINHPVHMANDDQWLALAKTIELIQKNESIDIGLIILDTLARCFAGGDENKAAEMGAFVRGCDMVKDMSGTTILVVHHTGKDASKNARGSSSLTAACDFEFKVKRLNKEGNGTEMTLQNTKMKDSEPTQTESFNLVNKDLCFDDEGEVISSLVLRDVGQQFSCEDRVDNINKNQKDFLTTLSKYENEVHISEISDAYKRLGKSVSNIGRTAKQLADKNLISFCENSKQVELKAHSLTRQGGE